MSNIRLSLQQRFPNGERFHSYIAPRAEAFAKSGYADKNFEHEFIFGDDNRFWSRVWEAMLFGRFASLGWQLSASAAGPDFRLTTPFGDVLVEATVPAPEGIPADWLSHHNGVYSMPHEQMLLRWTNSIDTKQKKHLEDIEKGHAAAETPFVIAINGLRLSLSPQETGISQWPFVVEAVFPFGPIEVPFNHQTLEFGDARQGERHFVKKPSGNNVPTNNFLNPSYSHVSALIGCVAYFAEESVCEKFGGDPPFFVINNPLAANPLPQGWLPQCVEYEALNVGNEEFSIRRITPQE